MRIGQEHVGSRGSGTPNKARPIDSTSSNKNVRVRNGKNFVEIESCKDNCEETIKYRITKTNFIK